MARTSCEVVFRVGEVRGWAQHGRLLIRDVSRLERMIVGGRRKLVQCLLDKVLHASDKGIAFAPAIVKQKAFYSVGGRKMKNIK